jgi:hypothetical protein
VAEATEVDASEIDAEEAGSGDQPDDDQGDVDLADRDGVEDEVRGEAGDRLKGLVDRLVDVQGEGLRRLRIRGSVASFTAKGALEMDFFLTRERSA